MQEFAQISLLEGPPPDGPRTAAESPEFIERGDRPSSGSLAAPGMTIHFAGSANAT